MKQLALVVALVAVVVGAWPRPAEEGPPRLLTAHGLALSGVRLGDTQEQVGQARGESLIGGTIDRSRGRTSNEWIEDGHLGFCELDSTSGRVVWVVSGQLQSAAGQLRCGDQVRRVRQVLGDPDAGRTNYAKATREASLASPLQFVWVYRRLHLEVSWQEDKVDCFSLGNPGILPSPRAGASPP